MRPNDLFKQSAVKQEIIRAKGGDAEANTWLGYRYFAGLGLLKNYNKARRCFEKGLPEPIASAWYAFSGLLDPKLWKKPGLRGKCYDTLQQLAGLNDPVGQTLLGLIYERGRANFTIDRPRAKDLYKAAAGTFALAGTHLGEMYLRERRYEEAINLFKEAANEGETGSMVNLADLYIRKRHPQAQILEARLLLRKAAELGDIRAQYRLAVLYHRDVVKREGHDAAEHKLMKHKYAFQLFHRCAKRGYPPALAAVALCYEHGLGTEKDDAKAKEWLKIVAESAAAVAAFCCERDPGAASNRLKDQRAEAWLKFAAQDMDRVATELGLPAQKLEIGS